MKLTTSSSEKPTIAWITRNGTIPRPSQAISVPNRTADISQALSTSLPIRNGCCLRRAYRLFSRRHALFSEPPTVRGQNW